MSKRKPHVMTVRMSEQEKQDLEDISKRELGNVSKSGMVIFWINKYK